MTDASSGSQLFGQPWVYEYIYPEASSDAAVACERIISRFQEDSGLSVLEVGCGIGRVISHLAEVGNQVCGIDSSEPMIEYGGVLHPDLRVELADMRTFDLGEQFDVVLCVGSTFTRNLKNDEVHATLKNFRKHCRGGGLLILSMLNASRFLGFETFNERTEMRVDEGEFHATAFSRHILDRRKQSFRRVRTWKIDGQKEPVIDDAEFRLFFPLEIEDYLGQHGFSTLGMWDNADLRETDLSDRRVYIAALAR
ncbi:MAG TPA: class I SAM-dependent methyltransferase [Armatimonadota bacterium]